MAKKLAVGVFSFTGDEGCVIELLELMNDHFFEWRKVVDLKYCRPLQKRGELEGLDVAFVEGAVSTEHDVERLKEIRAKAGKVVAIGSCAISGAPSNHRNFFDEERKREIAEVLSRFHHLPTVEPLKAYVQVDADVPGCPMMGDKFVEVLGKYLKEFGVA